MNDFFQNTSQWYEDMKIAAAATTKDATDKLEDLKDLVALEFDKQLAPLYRTQDLVKEAFQEKVRLREFKISVPRLLLVQFWPDTLRAILSIPFIYMMIVPAIVMHIFLELYHQVCFRLYLIPLVPMRDYWVVDRHHLAYLNWLEKINCLYCSYFNGLMGYAREVAARTERYWCPIKHAKRSKDPHSQYHAFVNYLEGEAYRASKGKIRKFEGVKEMDGARRDAARQTMATKEE